MRARLSVILALVIVVVLVAVSVGVVGREAKVIQPITFNHLVHLEDAGLECDHCHTDAPSHTHAGLPGKEICLDCHDLEEEADSHPEKAKLVPFEEGDEELPWVRVALTAPDVFFSHRRHVTAGQIDCLRCHPDQPSLTKPPPVARLVMSMDDCLACHEERGASTDCLACHR